MMFVYAIINGGGDGLDLVNPSRFEGLFERRNSSLISLASLSTALIYRQAV